MKTSTIQHCLLWAGIPICFGVASVSIAKQWSTEVALILIVASLIAIAIAVFTRPAQRDKAMLERLLPSFLKVIDLPDDDNEIRVAIHVPDGKDHLKPATRYMPVKKKAGMNKILNRVGIIGRAYITKKVQVRCFDSTTTDAEYKQVLQDEFHFTEEEIEQIKGDRRGFIAVPVLRDDEICGIIYCDAKNPLVIEELDQELLVERAVAAALLIEPLL